VPKILTKECLNGEGIRVSVNDPLCYHEDLATVFEFSNLIASIVTFK